MGIFFSASAEAHGMPARLGTCSRPDLADKVKSNYVELGGWCSKKLPIAYADIYNIGFMGLERFHPFDSKKFGKVVRNLEASELISPAQVRVVSTHIMHLQISNAQRIDKVICTCHSWSSHQKQPKRCCAMFTPRITFFLSINQA